MMPSSPGRRPLAELAADAEAGYRKILEIEQRVLGPEDPATKNTARMLERLAS
jgi:hypothetical protein